MIRIHRGAEPAGLAAARGKALEVLRGLGLSEHRSTWPPNLRKLLPGNARGLVIDDLCRQQERKCCYCEAIDVPRNLDVEHFRPVAIYPWLGWTWRNLLAACRACNQGGGKVARFPLLDDATRLALWTEPPGAEAPRLLDPADPDDDDPRAHLRFEYDSVRDRFVPRGMTPLGQASERGQETVRILGLDHDDHIERYALYVQQAIRPEVRSLRGPLELGERAAVVRIWRDRCLGLLAPTRPFRALAEDALRVFVATFPEPPNTLTDLHPSCM